MWWHFCGGRLPTKQSSGGLKIPPGEDWTCGTMQGLNKMVLLRAYSARPEHTMEIEPGLLQVKMHLTSYTVILALAILEEVEFKSYSYSGYSQWYHEVLEMKNRSPVGIACVQHLELTLGLYVTMWSSFLPLCSGVAFTFNSNHVNPK